MNTQLISIVLLSLLLQARIPAAMPQRLGDDDRWSSLPPEVHGKILHWRENDEPILSPQDLLRVREVSRYGRALVHDWLPADVAALRHSCGARNAQAGHVGVVGRRQK